jgi:hypothetical protein
MGVTSKKTAPEIECCDVTCCKYYEGYSSNLHWDKAHQIFFQMFAGMIVQTAITFCLVGEKHAVWCQVVRDG